jgi:hypothetical protein
MPETDDAALVDPQVNDLAVETTDGTEPSDETKTEPSETTETPKPGTPDKALQKMQQELGNATREIAALKEQKAASGGELTQAQQAKLAKAQQRIEKIRGYVSSPDDVMPEVAPIAEHLLDIDERLGKQDSLEAELRETKAQLAYLMNDHSWGKARAKYPNLDVDAIWEKANKDAAEMIGEDATDKQVNRVASKMFEERCEAAKKRHAEADPNSKSGKKELPAPSQYKVGTGQRVAPQLSEEDEMLQLARGLVVDN